MKTTPHQVLKQVFGYDDFRRNQLAAIESVLGGKDAFVLMPTGSGKSLCYQIPAIMAEGVGIIVSPLIALMADQVSGLRQNGVRAAYLNSTLSPQEAHKVRQMAADGGLDMLYVAPERLLLPDFQHFLTQIRPALFAIDEAHCVSQWGHDFRPEYLRISEVTDRFADTPRIALTATADAVTRKDILEKLNLQKASVFISSLDRPNICYKVRTKHQEKQQLLAFIHREPPAAAGIVYVRTRRRAETIAAWLSQNGVAALPYHAGLPPEDRKEAQRRFQTGETAVIVATIAFGMGIDKPDVRYIFHLDLPSSMEAYYQETGRAGRDGLPAVACMLASVADVIAMRRLFELSDGDARFKHIKRQKLDALLGYCEAVVCRRKVLLNYFGESFEAPCGTCDNCLDPVDTWDGTVCAQKALSCVYRTGQRFGVHHLTDVLLGKTSPQIERWGHDRIKTFGVGKEMPKEAWGSIFRQLLSAGLLSVASAVHGGLRLNDASWQVLKQDRKVFFRKDPVVKPRQKKKFAAPKNDIVFESDSDQQLFDALRRLRKQIAKHLSVPSYIIFADRTLKEIVLTKPTSFEDFINVNGVGVKKAQRYSEVFLDCVRGVSIDLSDCLEKIQHHVQAGDKGDAAGKADDGKKAQIVALLKDGRLSSAEIAAKVGVSPPTVRACKANLTTGKYKDFPAQPSGTENESCDWEPTTRQKEFIIGKIRELADLDAVARHYRYDSPICRYAKQIAPQILTEKPGRN